MQDNFSTKLLGIKDSKLFVKDVEDIGEWRYVKLERERENHVCPTCGTVTDRIHDYRIRTIKHTYMSGHKTVLRYRRRRYACPVCRTRFPEHNTFVEKHHKISRHTKKAILNEYPDEQSFKKIGKTLNVSVSTVDRWVKAHINPRRLPLPSILSIDEFKNLKSGKGKYACLFTNPETKEVIDVLPDRRLKSLDTYLSRIPIEERRRVKVVSTDLYDTYRRIITRAFPKARVVADKFHFVRQLYWAFDRVRVRVMKDQDDKSDAYYILKRYWRILHKYTYDLSFRHFFEPRFKYHITPREIAEKAARIHPDIATAIDLRDEFHEAMEGLYQSEAEAFFDTFIHKLNQSGLDEYKKVAQTFSNWKREIINAFPIIDEETGEVLETPPTNATIEGMNNKIKTIKRIAFGYRNFWNFRRRIMTAFNGLWLKGA